MPKIERREILTIFLLVAAYGAGAPYKKHPIFCGQCKYLFVCTVLVCLRLYCTYLLKVKMDGNNWEDNPDRQILDLAGVKTQHDERGPSYDDDK